MHFFGGGLAGAQPRMPLTASMNISPLKRSSALEVVSTLRNCSEFPLLSLYRAVDDSTRDVTSLGMCVVDYFASGVILSDVCDADSFARDAIPSGML